MRRTTRLTTALLMFLFAVAFLTPLTLNASGPVTDSALQDESYSQTRWVKGEIIAVGPAPAYEVQIRLDDKRELAFALPDGIKLRSADKAAFDGRKKLLPQDLAVGQSVRLTYREQPFKILELKVLKAGEASGDEASR